MGMRACWALAMVLGLVGSDALGAPWTQLGPDGGEIDAVAFDPSDAAILYAVSFGAGLFKSTDGGFSWVASDTGISGNVELAVVVDPTHPQTVYTQTSDTVWRSTDGGASWTGHFTGVSFLVSLVLDPTNPQHLFSGGYGRLAISTDGGVTWTTSGSFGNGQIFHVAVDPVTPSNVYVTLQGTSGSGDGVYRSTDGGQTFSHTFTLPFPNGVAVDPTTPTTVFAWNIGGLWRSTNSGLTFTLSQTGLSSAVTSDGLVVDPTTSSVVYALTDDGLFRSTDGGIHWSPFGTGFLVGGLRSLVLDPANTARLASGSSDGIALSTDGGATWAHHFAGLRLHFIQGLAYAPSSPNVFYAGSSLVGSWTSTDAGASWARHPIDLGAVSLIVDPTDAATAYATQNDTGPPGLILKTTDEGATWTELGAGMEGEIVTSLALARSAPNVLYAGSGIGAPGVFVSTDGGVDWSPTAGPTQSILAVAVDPTDADRVYAASGQLVYHSSDGGATWTPGITLAAITNSPQAGQLIVDPMLPSRIYYAVNAYPYGLFVSTDGGSTYALSLATPVNAIAVHPTIPGLVLAGASTGILVSADAGRTWIDVSGNLTGEYIDSAILVPGSALQAFVGTDGRGVWRRDIPPCATAADCDDGSLCTTDVCAPGGAGSDALGCRHDAVVCPPAGECRSATCNPSVGCQSTPALDFTPCSSDGLPCTIDECRNGVCAHDPREVLTCTEPGAPAGAAVKFDRTNPTDPKLRAQFRKLGSTATSAFGDPLTSGASDYAVCVFDRSGAGGATALVMGARVPAGGTCGSRPCWITRGVGFAYHDRDRTPDGVDRMTLVPSSQGRTHISATGRGTNLPPLPGSLVPPVTVQVQRDDAPATCWSARFDGAITANTPTLFKAKSD